MMQPFDISPPVDYERSNIIPLAAARPRGSGNDSRPIRALHPAPPDLVEQVRREDAAFNRTADEAYADAILDEVGGFLGLVVLLLVAGAIGFVLAIGGVL